ncbi:MAG: baseplate J/gp47 family protein, partial [Myxococcales bacterium]|nr:baseplate J/gp47 family protein [Myxococcales bacterium]
MLFRYSLAAAETAGLGFLGDDLRSATPELRVARVVTPGDIEVLSAWEYRRTLLNSLSYEEHYTLEDGTWRRVVGYQRAPELGDFVHFDYASAAGFTVRFGDSEFGVTPSDGTTFRVDYRSGPGTASNVAADVLRNFSDGFTHVTAITNPLPVTDGVDPESAEEVRQLAPAAFREQTYRAVRTEDYCGAASELAWVDRAGARARWTGSWTTVFVTPDPQGTFKVSEPRRAELEDLLDCRRQAGREVHVLDPRYRPVDLEITVCVEPGYAPSEVRDRVLARMRGDGSRKGFFDVDSLTFGTPIY